MRKKNTYAHCFREKQFKYTGIDSNNFRSLNRVVIIIIEQLLQFISSDMLWDCTYNKKRLLLLSLVSFDAVTRQDVNIQKDRCIEANYIIQL